MPPRCSSRRSRLPQLTDDDRAWVKSVLGETYVRLGRDEDAVRTWTEDHAVDPDDAYVTGALADLLLDLGRPADAAKLVADKEENDALLLRLALAESQLHGDAAKDADRHAKMLHERFAASHLRGDVVHRREEAREVLGLEHDPAPRAHPGDRQLRGAARAVGRARAPRVGQGGERSRRRRSGALEFLARGHLQDPRIAALAHDLGAP